MYKSLFTYYLLLNLKLKQINTRYNWQKKSRNNYNLLVMSIRLAGNTLALAL